MPSTIPTKLHWEIGTAYDLFICLRALHNPERFSLRPSWAAGVRSRLPAEQRKVLETADQVVNGHIWFVFNLPKPKGSAEVLKALQALPAEQRLSALSFHYDMPEDYKAILLGASAGRKWSEAEVEVLHSTSRFRDQPVNLPYLELLRQVWSNRREFGESYLAALQSFVSHFFLEEEQRLLPVLRKGLSHAQMRAGSLPLPKMLEELSSGVRYKDLDKVSDLYLAPSFWGAPLLFIENVNHSGALLMLFGARPDDMALIPGEVVPDSLLRGLKALADPTRLRILRYIAQSPETAAQLSRSLRLRPPTVAHHLNELRMAGLVQVIVNPEGERQYATRYDGFSSLKDLLNLFIHGD